MKLNSKDHNIWFTADAHFFHSKILEYAKRPFKDIIEMNETILKNYNSAISDNDIVFFLGDLAFGEENALSTLRQMKGTIHFIIGNHDRKYINIIKRRCESVNDLLDIEIDDQPITLCHYAMRVWHKSHFDSFMFYGHSHARLPPLGKQWDVGVDNNDFEPLSFDDITRIMRSRPHNENYIPDNKRR
jgi:calcineurin-like phosphoesterase family protein